MQKFEDLEKIAPGISMLSEEDHIAIQRFTILWSLFEAKFLGYWGSSQIISANVTKLDDSIFDKLWFEDELTYFKNRYYVENKFTDHFPNLNLRKSDNLELVQSVLSSINNTPKEQLVACLTIVYRFRNNLFHGTKWAYGIQDQQANFNNSVSLLKKCIQQFDI